jgi:hypothetical protein
LQDRSTVKLWPDFVVAEWGGEEEEEEDTKVAKRYHSSPVHHHTKEPILIIAPLRMSEVMQTSHPPLPMAVPKEIKWAKFAFLRSAMGITTYPCVYDSLTHGAEPF